MPSIRKIYLVPIQVTIILLVTAVFRLTGLIHISPPGIAHDEVANWLINRSILAGNHAIYFTRAYGHEAGFHYIQSAFVALLGDHVLALRLPAAFAGLLGVAVSYALVRRLFGQRVALISTMLLAVLFWPVFYSRLGLRAILLPLFSGLSATFFITGLALTPSRKGVKTQRKETKSNPPITQSSNYPITQLPNYPIPQSPNYPFLIAGFFAGLSIHTYMAARALPIFYGLFVVYLAVWQRDLLRQKWRGMVWFTAVFALTASPLIIYLFTNPGAEFRIEEVSAPLIALREGNLRPVLENGVKIMGMFGWAGDPLWRQNVAGTPVFEPVGAVLFYAGVGLALWRWKDGRYAFILLWLAVSTIPSLVTIDAPSSIRIINALPVLTLFPAILIHNFIELSTDNPHLSTVLGKIGVGFALTLGAVYAIRTGILLFFLWPMGGDVPFVWQAAFAETAVDLNAPAAPQSAAVGGWSPETMDPNSMALLLNYDQIALSHFNPEDGTLILPGGTGGPLHIYRPTMLALHPHWEQQMNVWGAVVTQGDLTTHYQVANPPQIKPQIPTDVIFGDQMLLQGVDWGCNGRSCLLLTYWQALQPPARPVRLFVQLVDQAGQMIAEDYHLDNLDPQSLWFPHWQAGDAILQAHNFPEAAAQAKAIRIGFFDPYSCDPGPCQNMLTPDGEPFLLLPLPE